MKKEIKAGLKEIYEAPPSLKKDEFLQRIGEPELTHLEFLRMQVHYIRKGNWLISVVFFLSALFALRQAELEVLWPISAFVPFLALSVVAENSRSLRYGMEELELSSRFSLKAIVMARMGVIGLGNLMLLLILAAFVWRRSSLLTAGVYLLLPYLLATFLNLMLVRKVSGKESIYSCLGMTILASAASVLPGVMNISIMGLMRSGYWAALLAGTAILAGREIKKLLQQSEELVWN